MEQNSKTVQLVLVALMSIGLSLLVSLAFFQLLSHSTFLSYMGLADSLFISDASKLKDNVFIDFTISQLIKNGSLISLDDIWAYQNALYQTIITFLIAINATVGGLAFFYIKGSSQQKIEEATFQAIETHFKSKAFGDLVESEARDAAKVILRQSQADFDETASQVEAQTTYLIKKFEELENENADLMNQIERVIKHVAKNDASDEDGKGMNVSKSGD